MARQGFQYYWDLLALDTNSYLVHYDFNASGDFVPSTQGAQAKYSGVSVSAFDALTESDDDMLTEIGDIYTFEAASLPPSFFGTSGSGKFSEQSIEISNASGMSGNFWTHFFVYEKTGNAQGILFSSMHGSRPSGYNIGVTDNNRLYFENVSQGVPQIKLSSQIYGEKNAIAVVKANNVLTFHNYNFDTKELESESFDLTPYEEYYTKASIGNGSYLPFYIPAAPFKGYIDEYIYAKQALTATNLKILFSGFYSEYITTAPVTGSTGYYQVTGYRYQPTGITGVTGYSTSESLSGYDAFGDPVYNYVTTPLTGYLLSGQIQIPLSGFITIPLTGEASGFVQVDEVFGKNGFGFNQITYLTKVEAGDTAYLNVYGGYTTGQLNLEGDYDKVKTLFELGKVYQDNQVEIFANGKSQVPVFNYVLNGFDVSGGYEPTDTLIYDAFNTSKQAVFISGVTSGQTGNITLSSPNDKMVFLNGILMVENLHYVRRSGVFTWITDMTSTEPYGLYTELGAPILFENGGRVLMDASGYPLSGFLSAYTVSIPRTEQTGIYFSTLPNFHRHNSQLFLNGYRQEVDEAYVENSRLDLLKGSGLFETGLHSVYNNDNNFWQ